MFQFRPREISSSPSRRTLLKAGFAGALNCALPCCAYAATTIAWPSASGNRRFSVLYKGDRIGAHTILYSSATGDTEVRTEIHMLVKVAFFTLFSYTHRSEEIWRDGRLISLSSDTIEDGETFRVEGAANAHGFRVVSKGGPFIAPAATLTSNSLWTPAVLERATVVDAQHGGIIGISAHSFGDEEIVIADRPVHATRYTFITPYIAGSIWYDTKNSWVRGAFERNGSKIQYELDA